MTFSTIPIWLVALVLAAFAPWCVRAFADMIEQRLRRRTAAVLARAGLAEQRGPGVRASSATEDIAPREATSRD